MPAIHRPFDALLRVVFALVVVMGASHFVTSTAKQILITPPQLPLAEARIEAAASSLLRELAQIDSLVEAEAWEEAIDGVLRIVDESSDELVAVSDDHYFALRDSCHIRIARWPAAALEAYRGRVDAMAHSRFDRGVAQRSESELQRVAGDYFCSHWGDDALFALGEMALERGDHAAARGYWQQISPALGAPDGRPWGVALIGANLDDPKVWKQVAQQMDNPLIADSQLVYPDSDYALADLLARISVVSIREGSFERAEVEAELLRRLYPNTTGQIGGRNALLWQAVAQSLSSARDWPARHPKAEWPTYAGDNRRGQIAAPLEDVSRIVWSHPLSSQSVQIPNAQQVFLNGQQVIQQATYEMLVEPVIANQSVVFRSGNSLHAIDLAKGEPLFGESPEVYSERAIWPARALSEGRNFIIQQQLQAIGGRVEIRNGIQGRVVIRGGRFGGGFGGGRFTAAGTQSGRPRLVAIDGAHVFATLGPREEAAVANSRQVTIAPRLLVLDLAAEGKLRLEIAPADGNRFSGPPVVTDDRLYLPMRENEAGQRLFVACYSRSTGRQLWRTAVCSFVGATSGSSDVLTFGDRMLYLNTNAGVIAAVHAEGGSFAWARTYPRATSTQPNDLSIIKPRPPGPCLLAGGALVCAPPDAPAIFALDPVSGHTLWTNDAAFDVSELLGVVDGKLIATGRRLWTIDVVSGESLNVWPESLGAGVEGSGRGCVAGDEVFWPTKKTLYTFNVKTGAQ
ncbi:MAG: PQQ-binding-like beta-propeller repeat protein, partial [Aeoliella sp.]